MRNLPNPFVALLARCLKVTCFVLITSLVISSIFINPVRIYAQEARSQNSGDDAALSQKSFIPFASFRVGGAEEDVVENDAGVENAG